MFFGRPWEEWISEYAQSHTNRANQICHTFGIPMIALSLPLFIAGLLVPWVFSLALGLFVMGWVLQFIGHAFERKWPEFFKDWRFLFVGLRWWWHKVSS